MLVSISLHTALPGLSPGVIAGVVVGTIVGLVLIVGFFLLVFFCGVLVAGRWTCSQSVCGYIYWTTVTSWRKGYTLDSTVAIRKCIFYRASHNCVQMQFNFQPSFWSVKVQQLLLEQLRSVSVAMLPMRATIVNWRTKMMTTSMKNWTSTKHDNFLCRYLHNICVTGYYSNCCVATILYMDTLASRHHCLHVWGWLWTKKKLLVFLMLTIAYILL